ncbi:hypothetical protein bcere0009_51130 [Bacillus cereus R309803]|nr:hypothetical protein bcere0009_51130 [Bacillus cereus R309803]
MSAVLYKATKEVYSIFIQKRPLKNPNQYIELNKWFNL